MSPNRTVGANGSDFEPGALTTIGNYWVQFYRSFITNRNTIVSFINSHSEECPLFIEKVCRRSELPIYPTKSSACKCAPNTSKYIENPTLADLLAHFYQLIRDSMPALNDDRAHNELQKFYTNTKQDYERCKNYVNNVATRNERVAIVSSAAVLGLFVSFCSRGKLRKLTYPFVGAACASYVVFPDQMDDYVNIGCAHFERTLRIAMNFVFEPRSTSDDTIETKTKIVPVVHKCSDSGDCICNKNR